jgi:hypothetical protein
MKKEKDEASELAKLVRLTKMIKDEKVKIEPTPPGRGPNKWRSKDPKFNLKEEKPAELVEGGGMMVDPSVKSEYDQWRQEKQAEKKGLRRLERPPEA